MKNLLGCLLLLSILACTSHEVEYKNKVLQYRNFKDELFKGPKDTPLLKEDIEHFSGLNYFPPNLKYKVPFTFQPYKKQVIANLIQDTSIVENQKEIGVIKFTLQHKEYSLICYDVHNKPQKLFIPFLDNTNGNLTYGGGRYVEVDLSKKDAFLDFNYAHNPYCAYNSGYVCALPPMENKLDMKVEAGEKMFKTGH